MNELQAGETQHTGETLSAEQLSITDELRWHIHVVDKEDQDVDK